VKVACKLPANVSLPGDLSGKVATLPGIQHVLKGGPSDPDLQLVIQEWQADRECRANLRRALHFDRTIVIFDDFLRDVESKAGAALALFRCKIRIENLRQLRLRNSVAGIFHADVDIKIFARATDGDKAFLFRGGLQRVNNYVLDRASNLDRITQ
jgi:hypothetical protein